jgi:hypothetical protein
MIRRHRFTSCADLESDDLQDELGLGLMYYNYQRVRNAHGQARADKLCNSIDEAPIWENVTALYDPIAERYRERGL